MKRLINGDNVNQLAPFKYPWAWKYYLNSQKNHWTPLDVNMTQDVADFKLKLNDAERELYRNVMGYLATSDIMAMRNIGIAIMEKITAPEVQQYQASQVAEEAIHNWTYQHCLETVGVDQEDVYSRYKTVPAISQKVRLAQSRMDDVMRHDIDLTDRDQLHKFLMSYTFFAVIFEGCWFYNGFSPIFSLQRRGLMRGTGEQLQYIMRDETMHSAFGIRVIREIMREESISLDPMAVHDMFVECRDAERIYADHILAEPITGYSADQHMGQFEYLCNRRAKQLGVTIPFPDAKNTLLWLDAQANLRKEKNFFETRVTEYQAGSALSWED